MIAYKTKTPKLAGTSLAEVMKHAHAVFKDLKKRTKRKPYIRSAYFNKQKIFFDYFWIHLAQKNPYKRIVRLKYFSCALDLIKNSRNKPDSMINPNKKTEILHRFIGLTVNKELFYVQIKEDIKTDRKQLMSVFPEKK